MIMHPVDEVRAAKKPMMRKFVEGPFKDLAFRCIYVDSKTDTYELEFYTGKRITVPRHEYAGWREKDCVTNHE